MDSSLDRRIISDMRNSLINDHKFARANRKFNRCRICTSDTASSDFTPCKNKCDVICTPADYHRSSLKFQIPNADREWLDVNSRGKLHAAVSLGDVVMAERSLRGGTNTCNRSRGMLTPMYFAIYSGCDHVVKLLIDWGSDVNEIMPSYELNRYIPFLHFAVWRKNTKIVQLFLHYGADVNATDSTESSALHLASKLGHVQIVRFLLAHGARVDDVNTRGVTPLHYAVSKRRTEVFRLLMKHGADVQNGLDEESGKRVLHVAIEKYDETIFQRILKERPNLDEPTLKEENSPLHCAVMAHVCPRLDNNEEYDERCACQILVTNCATMELLKRGARPNPKNGEGKTPLYLAVEKGCRLLVQLLLDHGADANTADRLGRSALRIVASKPFKCRETMEMLLVHGADYRELMKNQRFGRCREFAETVARFTIARRVMGLHDKEVDDVLSSDERRCFEDECRRELETMRTSQLFDNATMFQLLKADKRRLANLGARHKAKVLIDMVPELQSRYPIYGQTLRRKCLMAGKLAKVFKKAVTMLDEIFEGRMPSVPLNRIVSHLHHDEMRSFIRDVNRCSTKTK